MMRFRMAPVMSYDDGIPLRPYFLVLLISKVFCQEMKRKE